jgi:hypothetical protein
MYTYLCIPINKVFLVEQSLLDRTKNFSVEQNNSAAEKGKKNFPVLIRQQLDMRAYSFEWKKMRTQTVQEERKEKEQEGKQRHRIETKTNK